MRIPSGEPTFIDEGDDPQGLNSYDKSVLESFSIDPEDEEDVEPVVEELDAEEEKDDLEHDGLDGLKELEEMERNFLAEEPMLDFAMIGEEE